MTMRMRHVRDSQRGQSLLETIMALGIIVIAVTATIGLLISTMKSGRTSTNRVIAANLAREAIEAARDIRDSNWLKIQANDAYTDTSFDGLFDQDDPNPHHVRFAVFNYLLDNNNYLCPGGTRICYRSGGPAGSECTLPDGSWQRNYWSMEDIAGRSNCGVQTTGSHIGDPLYGQSCYRSYQAGTGKYDGVIAYAGKNSQCSHKYDGQQVTYPCARVFENHDDYYGGTSAIHGVGYGYFNQLPEFCYLKNNTPGTCNPMVGHNFIFYNDSSCIIDPPPAIPPYVHSRDPSKVPPTTPTPFDRWVVFDPICRLDNDADGVPDINPNNPDTEKVVITDGQTCAANYLLVGLRVQSHVVWQDGTGQHEVVLEDRLYNWKYVK